MNVFYLDADPKICAEMHLDKHVVKMIIEYAQLMSTAHRYLDGEEYIDLTANNRRIKRWRMSDGRENQLMKASHLNHPSGIWCRETDSNYKWLYSMWVHLLDEYTHRYGKIHACARLKEILSFTPKNINVGGFFPPTPAMPDEVKILLVSPVSGRKYDSLASYKNYYIHNKAHFAKWTKRDTPTWFKQGLNINNANVQFSQ
jgi:hypothetical protein